MDARNVGRLKAGLIIAVFVIPVVVALTMGMLGWSPQAHSYGERLQPARSLVGVPVQLADGQPFAWRNRDAVWTLVALPGPGCATNCLNKLDLTYRARLSLGRHADKLRLLFLGTPPAAAMAKGFGKAWAPASTASHALDAWRATAPDSVSTVLVTPSGKALLRYPPGFKAADLRVDLEKVVH